jgi:pilus assembly protein CpaF
MPDNQANKIDMSILVQWGVLSQSMAEVLIACVKAHINVIICGEAGSGKTTLLNALLDSVPAEENVEVIEDNSEFKINLKSNNWRRLTTKQRSKDNAAPSSQGSLINSDRGVQRDRLIIDNLSGNGTYRLLKSIKAGQNGVIAGLVTDTIWKQFAVNGYLPTSQITYGTGFRDELTALEDMVIMFGQQLPRLEARRLLAETLQVMVRITRLDDTSHRISEISEICGLDNEKILVSTVFVLRTEGQDPNYGYHNCRLIGSGLPPKFLQQMQEENVPFQLRWLW